MSPEDKKKKKKKKSKKSTAIGLSFDEGLDDSEVQVKKRSTVYKDDHYKHSVEEDNEIDNEVDIYSKDSLQKLKDENRKHAQEKERIASITEDNDLMKPEDLVPSEPEHGSQKENQIPTSAEISKIRMERKIKQQQQSSKYIDEDEEFIPFDNLKPKKVSFSTTIDGGEDDVYNTTIPSYENEMPDTTGMSLNEIDELQQQQESSFDTTQLENAGISVQSLETSADPFYVEIPDFDSQMRVLVTQSNRISQTLDAQKQRAAQLSQHLSHRNYAIDNLKTKAGIATTELHFLQDQEGYFNYLGSFIETNKETISKLLTENNNLLEGAYGKYHQQKTLQKTDEDQKTYEILSGSSSGTVLKTEYKTKEMEENLIGYDCEEIITKYHKQQKLLLEENASIELISSQLQRWEETSPETYKVVAYPSVPLCYEHCVTSELILLDPFAGSTVVVGNSMRFGKVSDMTWISKIKSLHTKDGNAIVELLTADVVVPYVCEIIEKCYEMTSKKQTRMLLNFLTDLSSLTNKQLPKSIANSVGVAAKNSISKFTPSKYLSSFSFSRDDFSTLGNVSQSTIFNKVTVLEIAIDRVSLITKCIGNFLEFKDIIAENSCLDIAVGFCISKSGYLDFLECIYPSNSFSSITNSSSALSELLQSFPKNWYSVDLAKQTQVVVLSEIMSPVRDYLKRVCLGYKTLRTNSTEDNITADRSLNSLCRTIGDSKAIKAIMSSL